MKIKNNLNLYLIIALLAVVSCNNDSTKQTDSLLLTDSLKIVSLNGSLSEILVELDLEKNIVGVDVTSTFPNSLDKIAKVGHNRNISAEGILALKPNLIIGTSKDLKPELIEQFKSTGIKLLLFEHDFSIEGTKRLISSVADSLLLSSKATKIINQLDNDIAAAKRYIKKENTPKVLFIYARGTGTMMVAGEDTQVEKMIELAGGKNAVGGFKDFKPLTSEALLEANPDVILLFSSGMESLGGTLGLEKVQGIAQTNAGKNKRFITMEGQLLTGFSPRLGLAIKELAQKIHKP